MASCTTNGPDEYAPPVDDRRSYTSGELAKSNLDGQLNGRRQHLERRGFPGADVEAYVQLLLSRTQFFGTFEDFGNAEQALASSSDNGVRAALTEARLAAATHRFDDAMELIDDQDEAELRDTIQLALGSDLRGVASRAELRAEERPNFDNLVSLGAARAALGDFVGADAAMLQALESYRDVSPLPVAWVQFQRGVMWAERADRADYGRVLYEEAVALVPGYVVANVHLAELEWEAGDVARAEARLRRIALTTGDPEPSGLLGEILEATDRGEEAEVWIERAESRYDALLSEHPEAFADHAAEFFSGPGGDPERAWALASANLEARADARAMSIALELALATDRRTEVCAIRGRAISAVATRGSVPLQALVAETSSLCSDS